MTNYNNFLDEINGKSINFLIGSGASVGVVPTLWMKSISKSFEELLTAPEYTDDQRTVLYYIWFNLWIRKTSILEPDNTSSVFQDYNNFISNVIIVSNCEGFDKPKRINLFTTNYDTLFELTFDQLASQNRLTFFNDGSRGFIKKYVSAENFYMIASHSGISDGFQRNIPTINLVKMHGSITWKKSDRLIEMTLQNELFIDIIKNVEEINQIITDDLTTAAPIKERILNFFSLENLENSIFDDGLTEDILKERLDEMNIIVGNKIVEFKKLYDSLPVVNPTKQKFSETVFEQHYYQMLRMLSFELEKKNSVLIVFGFSFADEHILEIVRRSMVNPFLQIYVIAYDLRSKKQIETALGSGARVEFLPKFDAGKDGSTLNGNFQFLNSLLKGGK